MVTKCIYIKKNNRCYTTKIQFLLDGKIQFVYENNHSRLNPEFQTATSLECLSNYKVLYSEQSPYETKYLYVLRKCPETHNKKEFTKLKNIIDELFNDYCEFVL